MSKYIEFEFEVAQHQINLFDYMIVHKSDCHA